MQWPIPAQSAAGLCRVSVAAARLSGVQVSVGESKFSVRADGVPVILELETGQELARVKVESPLRFTGSLRVDALPLRVKRTTDLFAGRIRIGKGSAPAWLGVTEGAIRISLDRLLGVEVSRPLDLDCDRVGLGDGTPASSPSVREP